jgi:endonuclease YncB( thermonuclease family)
VPLWTYPGVVTGPIDRADFPADLDLGFRWRLPAQVRIAGLQPHRGSPVARETANMLPVGTQFLALAQRIGHDQQIRAHIILADGTDVASIIRSRTPELPPATYGGRFDRTWRYPATVLRVCDADTFAARIDLGTPYRYDVNVRIRHVNAPEVSTVEGQAATVWAERVLLPGATVEITSRGLDKYGRPLADVVLPDGSDYGKRLIDAGHAVPYEGGPR